MPHAHRSSIPLCSPRPGPSSDPNRGPLGSGAISAALFLLFFTLSATLPQRALAQSTPSPTPTPLDLAAAGRAGDRAAAALEKKQRVDGSWGSAAAIRGLATSEAVIALRAWGRRGAAYYRGVTWLENRALSGVDYRARRILALAARGDDVGEDRRYLQGQLSRPAGGHAGWGLAGSYRASALDTALVLQAYGELGLWTQLTKLRPSLLTYLRAVRRSDASWPAVSSGAGVGDPVVTALVLRGYAAVRSAQPSLQTEGDAVVRYLQGAVTATASPLQRAHAALALLRWTPSSTATETWLRVLLTAQSTAGGWQGDDPYVTAVALQALAARLGRDAANLQLAVSVPDQELRAALNRALGDHRDRGDAVTRGDLLRISALNLRTLDVRDLRGLEFATKLRSLTLPVNSDLDRTPLAGLTELAPVVTTAALAPTGVKASQGSSADHVAVHWQPALGAAGYSIFRCATEAVASCGTAVAANSINPSYLDRGAPAGQPFYYRVKTHVEALTSPHSAAALGTRRAPRTAVVTTPLTASGDGTHKANGVHDVAVDGRGSIYATASDSDNVFRIAPDGSVTRILSATGDGTHALDNPIPVVAARDGTVYVAGATSDNVFRIAPGGTVTQILGPAGAGGHALDTPVDLAVDHLGRILVAARGSDNVFRIAADGTATRILGAVGDGTNALDQPIAVAATADGSVYVAGLASHNVFRIAPDGGVTLVLDSSGGGIQALDGPVDLVVDAQGNVLVLGRRSRNVFRIAPKGGISLVYDAKVGAGPALHDPRGLAVAPDGHIYVTGRESDNVIVIAPDGTAREILGAAGNGTTRLDSPTLPEVDAAGNVYVASALTHAVFRISTRVHRVLAATDTATSFPVREPVALALAGDGRLYVADRGRGRLLTVTRGGVLEGSSSLSAAAPSTVSALRPVSLALDAAQNFYVAGASSDNVVAGALWNATALRELVASAGDGTRSLSGPTAVVADAAGAVYVAGGTSDNVFRITAAGVVSQLIGSGGDGTHSLDHPAALALHSDGTLYVAGRDGDNVFRVTSAGVVSRVLAAAGAGGHALDAPVALALHSDGTLYVAGRDSDNVFRVPATGASTRVLAAAGDGVNALDGPVALAVDAGGVLYVAGGASHNVFAVPPGGAAVQLIGPSGDGHTRFHSPVALVARERGELAVASAGIWSGTKTIPAAVFRVQARPASAPVASPAPSAPKPLLWTIAPTRAQLGAEVDALVADLAADLTAVEQHPAVRAALEVKSGSLYWNVRDARKLGRDAKREFGRIQGAPSLTRASFIRRLLVQVRVRLATALNETAAHTEDALRARITAAQADVEKVARQLRALRDVVRRFPLTPGRTQRDFERETEPMASQLDLHGLSSPRRRAAAAAYRAERLTFAIHSSVPLAEAGIRTARSALAEARATLDAASTPIPEATVEKIVASLNRATESSWKTAWRKGAPLIGAPSVLQALAGAEEIVRQREIENAARAQITPAPDPPTTVSPYRRVFAETPAVGLPEIERLEREHAALAATTQNSESQKLLDDVAARLTSLRARRWQYRARFKWLHATTTIWHHGLIWRGLWENRFTGLPRHLQYRHAADRFASLNHISSLMREARFALQQPAAFTVEALQREVEAASQSIDDQATALAAVESEFADLVVPPWAEVFRRGARSALDSMRRELGVTRVRLNIGRRELAKARNAAQGSAEFARAGRALFEVVGRVGGVSIYYVARFQYSLERIRGTPAAPPAPATFTAAWIELTTGPEHRKEIEIVARELRDARVYATWRAVTVARFLPAAVASRFTAADQHVAAARRRLAGVRGVAATAPLPRSAADAIQRELGAARADVAAGLAALDRQVAPNVFALRGRLRDATAALDAAEAQIGRAETHLTAALPLPTGVDYAASLRGLETAWREVDLRGSSPRREVARYNREEQVETHRAHQRVARARREYLAAARAHLAKVSAALTPAPAELIPTLLAQVTGDLLGAEADRRALREEILGARWGEDTIRQRIRPQRDAALRRQPQEKPAETTASTDRQLWRTRLATLGDGQIAAELALQAALLARPPALQQADDARAASLRAAEGSVALSRRQLLVTRDLLRRLPERLPRWPQLVAEGFRTTHRRLRTAMNHLDQAMDVPRTALTAWGSRSAADLQLARAELTALRATLQGKTVPAGSAAATEADTAITALSARQKKAQDAVNRGGELTKTERQRLLREFLAVSTLGAVLEPLVRGFRAVDEATQPVQSGTPPLAPTGVAASGGTSTAHVAVSWSVRSGETYSVHRCVTAALASCGTAQATALTTSPYLDLTALAGQPFSYRVRAHNETQQSPLSAAAAGFRKAPAPQVATVLLTTAGDGTNGATAVSDLAVDGRGVVYAVAQDTDNAFRIAVDGTKTQILSSTGDGTNALDAPVAVAATPAGVVYVAGSASDNVFRVAADGTVTRLLAAAGDGTNALDFPADVAVEASGAVVVAGRDSDNVFRIAAEGTVTQILSATGDGTNALDEPIAVATAANGGVYVAGRASNNVFHVAANGTITRILSATGDGTHALSGPTDLAVDAAGNALVVGGGSGTVFRVTPAGVATLVFKAKADGTPRLQSPVGVAVDGGGQIYVSGHGSDNVVAIAPDGTVREVLGAAGVGTQRLDGPAYLAVDAAGNVYVAGMLSHTAFRVSTRVHKVLAATDMGSFAVQEPAALAVAGDGRLYVADSGRGRMFTVTRGGVLEGSNPLSAAAPSTVSVSRPAALALDAAQNFYVAGRASDNVVTGALWNATALRELVASAGDGTRRLSGPTAVVADAAGAVYVAGGTSDNVFRVTVAGGVSQLIGSGGDGTHSLDHPAALALHSDGTLYVAGRDSDNVFRVTSAGVVSRVLAAAGAGDHALDGPVALALNTAGDLFVASAENDNVFRVPATGVATRVLAAAGDGTNALDRPVALAVDAEGELYVAGGASHNVFAVSPGGAVAQLIGPSGDGRTRFHNPVALVARERGELAVATVGKTGAKSIPAAVFRVEARPPPPPPHRPPPAPSSTPPAASPTP